MKRVVLAAVLAMNCGSSSGGGPASSPDGRPGDTSSPPVSSPDGGPRDTPAAGDSGAPVTLGVPAARAAALAQLQDELAKDTPAGAAAFTARWAPKYAAQGVGYDPQAAKGFDLLQASHLKLNDTEVGMLRQNAFVITARQAFPSFFFGYKSIYADDLPVFISADSILYAVHRSYDAILKEVEQNQLITALEQLLASMHRLLGSGAGSALGATARSDADLFLTVARRLLAGPAGTITPVAGAPAAQVDKIVAAAMSASGIDMLPLFGDTGRSIDFSQFKPRGHYLGDARLEAYFRAMIWLGRTDLRLIAGQRFVRRQFEAAILIARLLDEPARETWQRIDDTLRGFVGESDNATVADLRRLGVSFGVEQLEDLALLSDQDLADAINESDMGIQRIASQILFVPPLGLNAPLDRAFLFFGQRYVLDSEVLSNVVFDRVTAVSAQDRRMLPDPLDVAFAALANTHAAPLLTPDLMAHQRYPAALHRARRLAEKHEPDFWNASLYHAWLGALRAMSPPADVTMDPMMPAVARTEPWARRVLNTQLASWAELRHDTLLYAKQSYTGNPPCEFPDAYVDPYPELWAALARYADRGLALVQNVAGVTRGREYFTELRTVALRLEDMAKRQRAGTPFSAEELAWVNEVVTIKEAPSCGAPLQQADGWYVRLFYDREDAKKMDPTIADVHTNPEETQVLHVGTGPPRLMVMTAETCVGPRAYVGLASSYFEKVTTGFHRLDDMEWLGMLMAAPPPDVAWMKYLVAH
jgi:hypothetical protein